MSIILRDVMSCWMQLNRDTEHVKILTFLNITSWWFGPWLSMKLTDLLIPTVEKKWVEKKFSADRVDLCDNESYWKVAHNIIRINWKYFFDECMCSHDFRKNWRMIRYRFDPSLVTRYDCRKFVALVLTNQIGTLKCTAYYYQFVRQGTRFLLWFVDQFLSHLGKTAKASDVILSLGPWP